MGLLAKKEVWEKPFRLAWNRTVGRIPIPAGGHRNLNVQAGAFSQQMALPWQTDFRECEADADTVSDPSLMRYGKPTRRIGWWPANRPDDVFPISSPKRRMPWARDVKGNSFPAFNNRQPP
jgi:hypothetical protein